MPVPASTAESFHFITIDVPPGGNAAAATAISDSGEVVGRFGAIHAGSGTSFLSFIYDGLVAVVVAPDSALTFVENNNNRGVAVGSNSGSVFSLNTSRHAFIYDMGTFINIDMPGAKLTSATDINDQGVVVGTFRIDNSDQSQHGFIYDSGAFTTIDVPGATSTSTTAINASGQIVGSYGDSQGPHGFLYDRGAYTTIDVPGATFTTIGAINDSGEVVGSYGDSQGPHGFLYDRGAYTTIDVPGATSISINGINNSGEMVGTYYTGGSINFSLEYRGFIYDQGTLTVIDVPGAASTSVLAINAGGDIVGSYSNANGPTQAFIATSLSANALLAIGILDTSTGLPLASTAHRYAGPVEGLRNEYINVTASNLYISAFSDNWFIHSGSGQDAIAVQGGTNVLDGGGGSNFMVGGSGLDTFFADARGAAAEIWDTVVNLHAGDACTVWGITTRDFSVDWEDGEGAAGFTGLTMHTTAPDRPAASVTLVGYGTPDLANGRLAVTFDTEPVSGSAYMLIQAVG